MATSSPSPANMPKPGPRPGAKSQAAPTAPAVVTMNKPPQSDPSKWGRIDDNGTVFVTTADGEREVGSWQQAPQKKAWRTLVHATTTWPPRWNFWGTSQSTPRRSRIH